MEKPSMKETRRWKLKAKSWEEQGVAEEREQPSLKSWVSSLRRTTSETGWSGILMKAADEDDRSGKMKGCVAQNEVLTATDTGDFELLPIVFRVSVTS